MGHLNLHMLRPQYKLHRLLYHLLSMLLLSKIPKHFSVINAGRQPALASASAIIVEPGCPDTLLRRLIFHQQFISGYYTLHLSRISPPVRVMLFRQYTIAAFNLLAGSIWREPHHSPRLLTPPHRAYTLNPASPHTLPPPCPPPPT